MSLRFGKWLSVFGSYVKLALLALFVILASLFSVVLGFTISTTTLSDVGHLPQLHASAKVAEIISKDHSLWS